eukprot:gene8624-biopygen12152
MSHSKTVWNSADLYGTVQMNTEHPGTARDNTGQQHRTTRNIAEGCGTIQKSTEQLGAARNSTEQVRCCYTLGGGSTTPVPRDLFARRREEGQGEEEQGQHEVQGALFPVPVHAGGQGPAQGVEDPAVDPPHRRSGGDREGEEEGGEEVSSLRRSPRPPPRPPAAAGTYGGMSHLEIDGGVGGACGPQAPRSPNGTSPRGATGTGSGRARPCRAERGRHSEAVQSEAVLSEAVQS